MKHAEYTCNLNSIINGTFKKLDEYVKQALKSKNPIDIFVKDYWRLFQNLKKEMGTSAGFQQWLPEYLTFKSIKNYLEERLQVKFKSEELTENLRKFVSENNGVLELRHNAPILPKEKNERMGIRPDIAIMLNGKPIAIFEIKVCVVDDKAVRGIRDSFNKILERSQNSPLLYVVLFSEKIAIKEEGSIAKELRELKKTGVKFIVSSDFHSNVISKDDIVLLKEALDKIYKKLELKKNIDIR